MEAMCAVAVAALLVTLFASVFTGTLERSRVDAAVRELATEMREARSQAITRGWEFRIVGYRDGAADGPENQYRALGRQSSAVDWPAEDTDAFESETQMAGSWTDLASKYPGVAVAAGSERFELTFDSRGTAAGGGALSVNGHGSTKTLTVSVSGSVKVE
jgi:Tfp pilus assembly protein FimT